jgi:choline kinase
MMGVVLAAGRGRRLHPLTATLPKTLLPLGNGSTILDVVLSNLGSVGIERVVIVTGFAAVRIEERASEFERRHGLRLELLFNDRAEKWNNAYSLWLSREAWREGALLVNGDAVHPPSVEDALLDGRGADVVLAIDSEKRLGGEEMKVVLSEKGTVQKVGKDLDPEKAAGEYIGVALIERPAAELLADALETTWRRDAALYYEDGFQEFVERGGHIAVAAIGTVDWIEVDEEADLAKARQIQCRS